MASEYLARAILGFIWLLLYLAVLTYGLRVLGQGVLVALELVQLVALLLLLLS